MRELTLWEKIKDFFECRFKCYFGKHCYYDYNNHKRCIHCKKEKLNQNK